jgi:alpha-ketoglutarate-dependent dioxygenase FTO
MNYYQYDIVTAGGKHSSRTFVKRCLVGEDGITYKYLGLRLFSHSWGPKSIPALQAIGDMNKMMIEMTQKQAAAEAMSLSSGSGNSKSADDIVGKCNYNLTLINYMEPTSHTSIGFKEESDFGMGKVSVSWHADSSLESNSSIGVYHCLPTQKASRWDWKIALRPAPESEQVRKNSSIAPVVVDTHDGDVYFLLGKMNETHHHAVLAGSQANRISSTHRVAVTGEDTYDYILKRVKIARKRFRAQLGDDQTDKNSGTASTPHTLALDAKVIRYCQQCLTEVEMEWIAQYWLQGSQHDKMHVWWQKPMKTLEAYWSALEEMTYRLFKRCCFHDDEKESNISIQVLKVLQAEFKNRQSLRQKWDERRADKIYQRRIAPEYRPVARPIFDDQIQSRGRLPKDLTEAINDLSKQIKNANQKTNRNLMAVTRIDIVNVQSNNASRKSPEKNKKRGPAEIRRTTQTNPSYNTKSISTSKRKKKRSKSHNA